MVKLAIFAGHGGRDPGAVSGSRLEKTYTLELMDLVSQRLRLAGVSIINNRTGDTESSVNDKSALANRMRADGVVDIHLNAGGGTGTETYCSVSGGRSRSMAEKINANLAALGYRNRGVKTKLTAMGTDYFGIIRMPTAPAVLVEVCFLDNNSDMGMYNANQAADAIAKALIDEFKPIVQTDPPPAAEQTRPSPAPAEQTQTSPAPLQNPIDFKVGARVTVKTTAERFTTGQRIASFVKGAVYFIRQVRPESVLISPKTTGAYTGWLNKSDVVLNG